MVLCAVVVYRVRRHFPRVVESCQQVFGKNFERIEPPVVRFETTRNKAPKGEPAPPVPGFCRGHDSFAADRALSRSAIAAE